MLLMIIIIKLVSYKMIHFRKLMLNHLELNG